MVKIDEVARAAGVSISTVSYALSGKRPVSAQTRARIEQAVRDLGYRPNAGARMLAGDRTHIFALTEPLRADTHAPTHMAFVLATTVAARRHDYDILLLTDEEATAGMSRVAASGLVDAIIVLDVAPDDPRVELSRAIDTPVVFVGVPDDAEGLVCVDLDFEKAAEMAADALADEGHAHIGLIGQSAASYRTSNFPPRVRTALERRGSERGLEVGFRASGSVVSDPLAARRGAGELLDAGATALVLHCPAEVHAAVLDEIAARGLSVPADVSVISVAATFDTASFTPAVDSIPLVPQASCDLAVGLAVRAIGPDPATPGLHLLAPSYLARGSVAPASTVSTR
jgi:DNA-binding LacI/PurR family transcriptional regulator